VETRNSIASAVNELRFHGRPPRTL
jgi:hypothetical protein